MNSRNGNSVNEEKGKTEKEKKKRKKNGKK